MHPVSRYKLCHGSPIIAVQFGVFLGNLYVILVFLKVIQIFWFIYYRNLTGTILSSSGDDGCVRMWKSKLKNIILSFNCYKQCLLNIHSFLVNYLKHWKCAAIIKQDGSQSPQDSSMNPSIVTPSTTLATTKYYKRGNLSHPNEVLLH